MTRELIFSILAFWITFGNMILYWRGIIKKEIIPHPFTMFIWVIVLGISSIELIQWWEYLWSVSISFLTIDVFLAMFVGFYKWKQIKVNWIDWFFLIAWIFLIIFWRLEPNYSYVLLIMIAIDATAYASSFKKTWIAPFTENSLPYFVSVGNNICTILAISIWNFENLGMWIWTAGINLTFAGLIFGRQHFIKK